MHDEVLRYHLDGEISDGDIIGQRDRLIDFVKSKMAIDGCVQHLDIDPQFTLDYVEETETYRFQLTVYGVYAGRDTVDRTLGVTGGKLIAR